MITGVGRRRRWTDEEKAWIVAESLDPSSTVSAVARRYGLHPSQLFVWRQQLAAAAVGEAPAFVPVLVLKERKTRFVLAARLAGKSAAETVAIMMAVFRRLEALGHDPGLLLVGPAAPPTDAGDHLDAAEAVVVRTGRTTMITHRSRA